MTWKTVFLTYTNTSSILNRTNHAGCDLAERMTIMTIREKLKLQEEIRRKNDEAFAAIAKMRRDSQRQNWEYNIKPVMVVLAQGFSAVVAGVLLFLVAYLLTP